MTLPGRGSSSSICKRQEPRQSLATPQPSPRRPRRRLARPRGLPYEPMLLRLRAMTAAELKKPRGALWGRCPWGYHVSPDGMRLEPYEPEQAVKFVVRDLRLRGLKLREITEELKKMGIVSRRGKPMSITRIYELLDEGEGSRRDVLIKRTREVEDDQPPESSVVERSPYDRARTGPRGGSAAK
jgi:hypothetical protein